MLKDPVNKIIFKEIIFNHLNEIGYLNIDTFDPSCSSFLPNPNFGNNESCYVELFYNLTKKLISAAENLCAKSKSETDTALNQAIVEMKFLEQNWHSLSDQQFAKYIEKVDEIDD